MEEETFSLGAEAGRAPDHVTLWSTAGLTRRLSLGGAEVICLRSPSNLVAELGLKPRLPKS